MYKNVLLVVSLSVFSGSVLAQGDKEYSDEELKTYASVMKWAKDEKSSMTSIYNGWINGNEDLEAARFVKIKSAKGDSVKLRELEVTSEELLEFTSIIDRYDSMVASFKVSYTTKIKDDIGASLYNSLRKDMKKDETLKARYEEVLGKLEEAPEAEGDE